MTQLTFDQFVHPLSEFPSIVHLEDSDEPMLDMYTMAGVLLYAACANGNLKAQENILETLAAHRELDGNVLFERCRMGDRAAILQTTSLIVAGLENSMETVEVF
ncbi:hypothetical protein H6G33_07085 [Calothrix sp. FACHB-1219]|uniref:hypothetical protein n=1 Tax=unclassified Calothrix TaxID=2619626 RepID=UPI00168921F4|nr:MULTISPECIES: hypothetical protein [unclassified Calothrix]MBD2204696.1 hypothetical protein [Calothrix sp. FACHB-168]MBD2216792.1 hypothetical protein [Calothrix sp. FACHB-1219]